jgi:methyl-accepting chemotaxis protein
MYMCWRSQVIYNGLVVAHHVVMTFLAPALIWHATQPAATVSDLAVHAAIAVILVPPLVFVGQYLLGSMIRSAQALSDAHVAATRADEAMRSAQQATVEAQGAARRVDDALAVQLQADQARVEVVDAIAGGLGRLAGGELMFRLDEPFDPAYETLRQDFNGALDTLLRTMVGIAENASIISEGSQNISASADSLARRIEQQAAALEQTSASLTEITATVEGSAEAARSANSAVAQAKADAEASGVVMGQAVDAMAAIRSSSEAINQIIGVIDGIAFQTNLLALNAGVEAARAGDAGRGFAVVAAEVRALAQRSAESALQIKALISASGKQVQDGVELVDKTGVALTRILDRVAEVTVQIDEVARAAKSQAVSLKEINSAVAQMDQMTQKNAVMVEESTAASHAMATQAGELTRRVGQFDVGRGYQPKPMTGSSAPGAAEGPKALANRVKRVA